MNKPASLITFEHIAALIRDDVLHLGVLGRPKRAPLKAELTCPLPHALRQLAAV